MQPHPLALAALLAWFAWWFVAHAATLAALVAVLRQAARIRRHREPERWPEIAILRPCEGEEDGLEAQLGSSLCAYPGRRRVLLLVPSLSDAARAVCERVRARAPAEVEVLVTDPPPSTRNRKSAQLQVALDHLRAHPEGLPAVIVQADSDVAIDARVLRSLIAALGEERRTAASFAAPVEPDGHTAGDFASSGLLSASQHDLYLLAALARMFFGVVPLAGALAAHKAPILVQTGGFGSLEGLLGEDFEIGRRLARAGHAVAVAGAPALCAGDGRPLSAVIERTTRWAMVVRQQRARLLFASYPIVLAAAPPLLLLSLVLAVTVPGGLLTTAHAVWLLGMRALLAAKLRRLHGLTAWPLTALALDLAAEALLLVAVARALVSHEVVWRGRRLRIERGGRIVPLDAPPAPARVGRA